MISQDPKRQRLTSSWRDGLRTPPRLSVPDWADKHRVLAKEAGSTGGPWDTSVVEVARGPMLAVTEPGVHVITVMCCTQLLKTALIESVFGFFAHTDPCPMLLLQPKEAAAEQFSKERITPMIKATPVLRDLIGSGGKTRKGDETLLFKQFPGGFLALAGAGSPDNLARRPIRVLLSDEVDKYPVTREGDPIMLAEERTATFGLNWLSVRACSPTIEDESRIAASYAESDQRKASVECPHCNHRQFLDFFKHVEWDKDRGPDGEVRVHHPKTARLHCESCGAEWSEGQRLKALATVRWHQTRVFEHCGVRQVPMQAYEAAWRDGIAVDPVSEVWDWWEDAGDGRYAVYRAKCRDCGAHAVDNAHAGFQASKLFSPWQKDKPSDIADKWLKAKGDPDKELVWWNTQMGLPHRPTSGRAVALDTILSRREVWAAEVPDGVAVITVGIDTQDYRVELEVVGWGADEESWSIDYHVIDGEFSDPAVQARLDAYLKRTWRDAEGRTFEVLAACHDSGGHHTQAVYDFSKARLGRRIWAVKGASERDGQRNPVWPTKKPSRKNKASFRPVVIGGNSARDTIRGRLSMEAPQLGQLCPGYMHFPADRDIGYFEQLLADRLEVKEMAGRKYRVWVTPSGKANEAADCRVYAYAALCGLMHLGLQLNKRAKQVLERQTDGAFAPRDEVQPRASAPEQVVRVAPAITETTPKKKSGILSRLA